MLHALRSVLRSAADIFFPLFFLLFFFYITVRVRRLGFGYDQGWVYFIYFII